MASCVLFNRYCFTENIDVHKNRINSKCLHLDVMSGVAGGGDTPTD